MPVSRKERRVLRSSVNGAGKSTFIQILAARSGRMRAYSRQGEPYHVSNRRAARPAAFPAVFQELSLIPDLTVEQKHSGSDGTPPRSHGSSRAVRPDTLRSSRNTFQTPADREVRRTLPTSVVEVAKALAATRMCWFSTKPPPRSHSRDRMAAALARISGEWQLVLYFAPPAEYGSRWRSRLRTDEVATHEMQRSMMIRSSPKCSPPASTGLPGGASQSSPNGSPFAYAACPPVITFRTSISTFTRAK